MFVKIVKYQWEVLKIIKLTHGKTKYLVTKVLKRENRNNWNYTVYGEDKAK